jgi:signal transduction histidine kinase
MPPSIGTDSSATGGEFPLSHQFLVHALAEVDNGGGIDPQFHERIFEVFQTLKPRDEVEGSGMGLAIAKKTVEHAGGRIWLESVRGQGSAFYFTWPSRL